MKLCKAYLGPWRRRLRLEINVNVYSSPLCVILVLSMKPFTTGVAKEVHCASKKGAMVFWFQQNFSSMLDQSVVGGVLDGAVCVVCDGVVWEVCESRAEVLFVLRLSMFLW